MTKTKMMINQINQITPSNSRMKFFDKNPNCCQRKKTIAKPVNPKENIQLLTFALILEVTGLIFLKIIREKIVKIINPPKKTINDKSDRKSEGVVWVNKKSFWINF